MPLAKFNCENCDKGFTAGEWFCQSGVAHVVAAKTYYVMDAPADKKDVQAMKSSRLLMCNVIPERKVTAGAEVHTIPGRNVEFIRGMFSTTDPELQNALNSRNKVFQGEEGHQLWEKEYLTAAEKAEMEHNRQNAYIKRLENDNNRLLDQVKEKAKPVASKAS